MNVSQEVIKELTALKEIIKVPQKALELAENKAKVLDYYENGMSIGEIADLLIMHASIK